MPIVKLRPGVMTFEAFYSRRQNGPLLPLGTINATSSVQAARIIARNHGVKFVAVRPDGSEIPAQRHKFD